MAVASNLRKPRDKVINLLAPYFLIVYSFVSLISWFRYPSETLYTMLNEGTTALIFRVVLGAAFTLYMGLICLFNKKLPPWRYTLLFAFICLYLILLIFIQDKTYVYDPTKDPITVTTTFTIKFYLGWAYSAFMAYCLLFVLPIAKTQHKIQFLPFLIFWAFVGLVFIGYSVAIEFDFYKNLSPWKGENKWLYIIHSFFSSKNSFGAALFGCFASSILLGEQMNSRRKIPLLFIGLFYFVESIFIRCSTAYVAEIATLACLYLFRCIQGIKKFPKISLSFLSLGFACLTFIALVLNVPSIYESHGTLARLRDVVVTPDYSGRVFIWQKFFFTLTSKSAFFGWGPLGKFINGYLLQKEINEWPLENSFLDVFCAGGIVFLAFYVWVLSHTAKKIWFVRSINKPLFAALLACFIGCVVYGMTEINHFVFSSSSMTFVGSFIIAAIPASLTDGVKKE
jgi:hypothetical protein